jgi:replicative DNA helicase
MNKPVVLADLTPIAWPHNLEAEQALLGAIMVNSDVMARVAHTVNADMFYEPVHGEIFGTIQRALETGVDAKAGVIVTAFKDHPALRDVGGAQYIIRLATAAVTILDAPDYAKTVRDCYLRRRLMEIGDTLSMSASDPQSFLMAGKLIQEAEKELFDLSGFMAGGRQMAGMDTVARDVSLAMQKAKANPGGITGVATGLRDLDKWTGGFHGGDYILLGGRPGMGKTALALSIARNVARQGNGVLFLSLEMPREQLGLRLASMQGYSSTTQVAYSSARRGMFDDRQWERFEKANADVATLPILIDDKPGMTIAGIKMDIRRALETFQRQGKELKMVVVDYLGLVTMGDRYKGNRVNEIAEASKAMKQMALEFNLPFLVLSQLSRGVESREDKKPSLADLRDSGALEQDADMVLFAYREYYYRKDDREIDPDTLARLETKGEIIIAKQRNGPTKDVELFFDAPHGLWGDRY